MIEHVFIHQKTMNMKFVLRFKMYFSLRTICFEQRGCGHPWKIAGTPSSSTNFPGISIPTCWGANVLKGMQSDGKSAQEAKEETTPFLCFSEMFVCLSNLR